MAFLENRCCSRPKSATYAALHAQTLTARQARQDMHASSLEPFNTCCRDAQRGGPPRPAAQDQHLIVHLHEFT